MNINFEKLKQLALNPGYDGEDGPMNELNVEKFAELIVRECARQAAFFAIKKNQIHPDITYDQMSDSAQTVCHMTSHLISENIREHFGVE